MRNAAIDTTAPTDPGGVATDTSVPAYTERLDRLGNQRWKQLLDVQAPYRWNIRRLKLGRTLDVGCGLGRNLRHLDGNGVGIDHNPASVARVREAGLLAYTNDEFVVSAHARLGGYDSLLAAHLLEHLSEDDGLAVLDSFLPYVRGQGKIVLITPQEAGYRSDASHVRFVGFGELADVCDRLGLVIERDYSFPFPRAAGRVFTHNEFVMVARKR